MEESFSKKTRLQDACLTCRSRKVRCDSGTRPDRICSNCLSAGLTCTHSHKKKRGPKPIPKAGISQSFDSARTLVSCILAAPDTYPIPESSDKVRSALVEISRYAYSLQKTLDYQELRPSSILPRDHLAPSATSPNSPSFAEAPSNDADTNTLSERLEKLSLDHRHIRHFGSSSNFFFVQALLDFKHEVTGSSEHDTVRRSEFWNMSPWQREPQNDTGSPLVFPESDLLHDLIDIYFAHFEIYVPLLHQETFMQSIADGLHLIDIGFGQVVLAVCAVASKCSSDPRNMPEGTDSEHSMGWRWYCQISLKTSSFLESPRLYDVQLCVLMVTYLSASSFSESNWIILGIGMRLAQAVGIHRKRPGQRRTLERELSIRAFWAIVNLDGFSSMFLGRPRVTSMDDYDLEYPSECDQEYWDTESDKEIFVQPPNKPSKMAFYIHMIKLFELVGQAQRLIYPIRKSESSRRGASGGGSWNQQTMTELDFALNAWLNCVPDHLKWDPKRSDSIFLQQSILLHTTYHWLQIQVHKPFIPRPGQDDILTGFPSMTICVNAARSCLHISESSPTEPYPHPMGATSIFASAVVLLINFWRKKRSDPSLDASTETNEVNRCFKMLRPYEKRYQTVGRMIDVLNGIISVGHIKSSSSVNPVHDWITNPDSEIPNELAGFPGLMSESLSSVTHSKSDVRSSGNDIQEQIHRIDSGPSLPSHTNELVLSPLHASPYLSTVTNGDAETLGRSVDQRQPSSAIEPYILGSQFVLAAPNTASENSLSDQPSEDWTMFMENVDQLWRSASNDFRMPDVEPS